MRKESYYTHLAAVLEVVAEDKGHPIFRNGCGNTRTLAHPDVPQKVKQFYDQYYAKSKVSFITLGDSSKLDLDAVGQVIGKAAQKTVMKDRPSSPDGEFQSVRAPKATQDLLIFIDSKYKNFISFLYFIDVEKSQMQSLEFLRHVISTNLAYILLDELKEAVSADVVLSFEDSFAFLEVKVVPTISARKSPSQLLNTISDFLNNLHVFNSLDSFTKVTRYSRLAFYLQKKVTDDMGLLGSLNSNFGLFGLKQLFIGSGLLTRYKEKEVKLLADRIRISNKYVLVMGDFDHATAPVVNNYLDFFHTDLTRDNNFGTETNVASKIQLEHSIPEVGIFYSFFRLHREDFSKHLKAALASPAASDTPSFSKVVDNLFVPTISFLQDLSTFKQSDEFSIQSARPFVVVVNEKYAFPNVNILFRLNFAFSSPSRESFIQMEYFRAILVARMSSLSIQFEQFRNKVSINLEEDGLVVSAHLIPDSVQPALTLIMRHLQDAAITKPEHETALDHLRKASDKKEKPFTDARKIFSRSLFPNQANHQDFKAFIKQNLQWHQGQAMPQIHIDHTHLEYARYHDFDVENVKSALAAFPNSKAGFASVESLPFPQGKILLYRGEKSNPSDKNSGYFSAFLLGPGTPQVMAKAGLLDRLINDQVFEYLRNQKHLGYVTTCFPFRVGKLGVFAFVVQGDKPIQEIEQEVENFFLVAENYLRTLEPATFQTAVKTLLEMLKIPFQNPEDEAKYWFRRVEEGYSLHYIEEMKAALATSTQQEMLDFYLEHFKNSPRRIITQAVNQDQQQEQTSLVDKRYTQAVPLVSVLDK